jgi:glycosyltransferase involved in cell wall biosynthesis
MIHFFTKGNETVASSHCRAFRIAELLAASGVETTVHRPSMMEVSETPWPKKIRLLTKLVRALLSVGTDDIIFLQRTIYNKYFFVLIFAYRFFRRRLIVFDIDDAIYLHNPFKTKALIRLSDAVFAGSRATKAFAERYNRRVFFIPTCVESVEPKGSYASLSERPLRLGWVGNARAHAEDLVFLKDIFCRLGNDVQVLCSIIGVNGSSEVHRLFANLPNVVLYDWVERKDLAAAIREFDFGLVPLLPTEWNDAKAAMKINEYLSAGVPVIASPVGESRYIVTNGKNGYLADTPEAWIEVIRNVHNRFSSLETLGREAVRSARYFLFETQLPLILDAIREIRAAYQGRHH